MSATFGGQAIELLSLMDLAPDAHKIRVRVVRGPRLGALPPRHRKSLLREMRTGEMVVRSVAARTSDPSARRSVSFGSHGRPRTLTSPPSSRHHAPAAGGCPIAADDRGPPSDEVITALAGALGVDVHDGGAASSGVATSRRVERTVAFGASGRIGAASGITRAATGRRQTPACRRAGRTPARTARCGRGPRSRPRTRDPGGGCAAGPGSRAGRPGDCRCPWLERPPRQAPDAARWRRDRACPGRPSVVHGGIYHHHRDRRDRAVHTQPDRRSPHAA